MVREERGNERKNQPATFSWKPSSAIRFPPAVSPSICPVWGGSMTLCHLSQLSGVPELLGPESPACVALGANCGANTGVSRDRLPHTALLLAGHLQVLDTGSKSDERCLHPN